MTFWLVMHGRRYLANKATRSTWTTNLLCAKRFRTRAAAEKAARQHAGAIVVEEPDFDGFPS